MYVGTYEIENLPLYVLNYYTSFLLLIIKKSLTSVNNWQIQLNIQKNCRTENHVRLVVL